jgi:DNA polymerase-3 subunit gamma/tau
VLARKWRPLGFDEVQGQTHVTTPLRNAIRSGRIPHALLFTGPRGTGKTTLARIFASCLNAEKGPTDAPDAEDPAVRAIQNGTSTDVQEVDAASRTSVDDVREIIESIRYAAAPGKWRIFIVDEVHMLSTPAFNALLKTLEEPPPKSLFIFCTTNPEKIPFTVVSRCQRYDLRRIPTAEVAARLEQIAKAEGIEVSRPSLLAIARAGEGSLRDSLTLLDQLLAYGAGKIEDARVAEVLDLVDRAVLAAIAGACIEGDAAAALAGCRKAWDAGVDARRLGGELLRTLRDLVVLRVAPEAGLVEAGDAEIAALRALAGRAEEARLRRMFRALLREQEDLAWAPDPFAVLEMAVVRLASLPPGDQVEELLARIDALERRLRGESPGPESGSGAGGGSRAPGPAPRPAASGGGPRRASERAEAPPSAASSAASAPAPLPAPAAASEPPRAAAPALAAEEPPDAEEPTDLEEPPHPAEAAGAASPALVFDRLRAFAQQANRGLFAAFEGGRIVERRPGHLRIALPSATAARRLELRAAEVDEVCSRFFGHAVRVALEVEGANGASAPARDPAEANAEVRRRRHEALQHPAVNAALEVLNAEIVEIRPLGERP